MSGRHVPDSVVLAQRKAAAPGTSAWVTANAGSGKTFVLARRVVRLLLAGARPSRLLCLTFTKAAAANMQNRIFRDLADWARLDDATLAARIEDIGGAPATSADLRAARRLFAEAIETPGGLKILTIHGFCERLLRLFPFEANVPAGFAVLEPRAAAELIARARAGVLLRGLAHPDTPLGRAIATLERHVAENKLPDLLDEVTKNRDAIAALITAHGGVEKAEAALAHALGLASEETVTAIDTEILAAAIPASEWPAIAAALRAEGSATAVRRADAFDAAALAEPGEERLRAYLAIFTTAKGEPLAASSFLSHAIRKAEPGLSVTLEAEHGRLSDLLPRRKAALAVERSAALLVFAQAMIDDYAAAKMRASALDFDDLVARARDLLVRAGAEWVLFKLDQGIDHILVDEAQDTSPDQWLIVEALAGEFFAGEGARPGAPRTVFAVGDEKQSIFSFQGAAPDAFAEMRRRFERAASGAGQGFADVRLQYSFRSTADVLAAVDRVFAVPDNRRGLSDEDIAPLHQTIRSGEPGRVEIWPVEQPLDGPEITPWDAPFDRTRVDAPAARLARRIAATIARWTTDGVEEKGGARLDPGEVMILVRNRGPLFHGIIRALKQVRVPVAGADRLVLTEHIAVMDLVALGRWVLRPEDDLTLATVLKTPLIGFDDEDLLRLAPGRPSSLWAALAADADPRVAVARSLLATWLDEATRLSPFAFYSAVLARDGGRRAFLQRLGGEAADALDEFIAVVLAYQAASTPSLEGFLAWLGAADTEVKRDMDVARGEVRVMTAHGAKGLEARVVILADTCSAPNGRHDARLFFIADPDRPHAAPPLFLWTPGKDHDPELAERHRAGLRAMAEAEHRRLLYVAMTRAEDCLIVAGAEGARGRPAGNWYDMIAGAVGEAPDTVREPMPDGEGKRLVFTVTPPKGATDVHVTAPAPQPAAEPVWLRTTPAPERVDWQVVRPSDQEDATAVRPSFAGEDEWPATRGRLIHRLLQILPDLAEDPHAAAMAFLQRAAPDRPDQHESLARAVVTLLRDPAFAPVFAAGSRAEVPIIGRLPRLGRPDLQVAGRVDRLVVTQERVLVVDFKTNAMVPASVAEAPEAYLGQLALYRAVLARVFPGRAVEAALAWTQAPALMPIPQLMLDDALRAAFR
ncbi:MAG: double-strand break repair helicase AddA [Labrys sp. (in: a-proteobacteria)]